MPNYTDMNGITFALNNWSNDSHRGRVINNARALSNFRYVQRDNGTVQDEYQCFYCKEWYAPVAIEGDHIVNQSAGRSSSKSLQGLYQEAQEATNPDGTPWNLVISCQLCNGSSRNRKAMYTRSMFKKDRDDEKPNGGNPAPSFGSMVK